jgi:tRNA pseudouridine38-40 synthase
MGQVASARLESRLDARTLLRALNARLPRDLAVLDVEQVPAGWDALREARGKHYRYQIWNGPRRSPLRLARWYWVAEPLDLEAMQQAAPSWVGRHDFAAFQGAGSAVKTTVRTLEAISITGASGAEIQMDFRGEGFLRHMVRNLAGTLIEIGRGRWCPAEASEILGSCERARAGPTAPALGLQLMAVRDSWSEGDLSGVSVDAGHPVG